MNSLDLKLQEMAGRIRDLREIEGLTESYMAEETGVSLEEYRACEAGECDLNFAFIYRCAQIFRVDVTDIIEGSSPRLANYTLTRAGEGQHIEHAHGMTYFNMAPHFKKRVAEPLYVLAEYSDEAQLRPIEVTSHEGQECDIVLQGQLKVQVGEHIEILNPGDTIYYNSTAPHGMIATGGKDCIFYAIVLNSAEDIPLPAKEKKLERRAVPGEEREKRIWEDFIDVAEGEDGSLQSISFKDPDHFNFAFDVVDELARRKPEKLALLHVDKNKVERRFTFEDISRASNRAANYFKSLGIRRGDRVLLILKRHYQFWIAMMGLNKLGAVALLASNQMLSHDLEYRFKAAGITAVVATGDDQVPEHVEEAAAAVCPGMTKILVNGGREGWHDFDSEYAMFRSSFPRTEDAPQGEDLMLMFFTSGTTGYPKAAAHCHKYPLGHFITAKYWHCVDPEGLHLTISDTGWAKSMWGKLYGQWLNEAAVFVYDFDRFDAHDILPMFEKYHITTFCAPPTMYRMLIKEDIGKYDLSSIQHATIAGEALNPEVFHQFQKATGLSVMEGFGQSETTVMIGNLIGMSPKVGSMGKPVPLYPVDLVDAEGESVPVGQVGEIVIRAEREDICGLFRGYYNNPEGTDAAWHDGLYHTGDTAWRDEDGYFWYVGRVDDLIKSSGYRIGPFEIESVIMELPYVLECGVSAAPDEIRGQVVKASIVLTKGTEGTEALKKEIQTYVKQHTAPYKYPRIVVFKDELPKTTSGKIIRSRL
ncbi:MAG: AMP-binding protein [Oscillospiraceae bacterium]|nr:AMP-binding protein [Oscillospiraceae bacterium]